MEFVITFFRDILDGPVYIVVTIICIILICSCIGYLAETSLNKKKAKQEYDATHANLSANQETTAPVPDVVEQAIPSSISNEANNVQVGIVTNTVSSVENINQPSVPNFNVPPYNPQVNPSIPSTVESPVSQPTVVNTNQNINQ